MVWGGWKKATSTDMNIENEIDGVGGVSLDMANLLFFNSPIKLYFFQLDRFR